VPDQEADQRLPRGDAAAAIDPLEQALRYVLRAIFDPKPERGVRILAVDTLAGQRARRRVRAPVGGCRS
jgi:hypothetical protein